MGLFGGNDETKALKKQLSGYTNAELVMVYGIPNMPQKSIVKAYVSQDELVFIQKDTVARLSYSKITKVQSGYREELKDAVKNVAWLGGWSVFSKGDYFFTLNFLSDGEEKNIVLKVIYTGPAKKFSKALREKIDVWETDDAGFKKTDEKDIEL